MLHVEVIGLGVVFGGEVPLMKVGLAGFCAREDVILDVRFLGGGPFGIHLLIGASAEWIPCALRVDHALYLTHDRADRVLCFLVFRRNLNHHWWSLVPA